MSLSTNCLVENDGREPILPVEEMRELLHRCLQFDSISGNEKPFTEFIANWGARHGFTVDLWQADESQLNDHPFAQSFTQARHIPLANRPTLVVTHPADASLATGRSLMFNAHADVVAAPDAEQWSHPPFAGEFIDGKFFGRGACDVKGPMVSALGAMLAIKQRFPEGLAGDVSLELIPGEEDCVGLGTLTSVIRGHGSDGVIVLEPTEEHPRIASRGGCRFEIVCRGRAVHGTVKWLGDDAIQTLRQVLDALNAMESRWNDRQANLQFSSYPIARPITVDIVHAGQWQGMIADKATCAGYLELLPGDDLMAIMNQFRRELTRDVPHAEVQFSETYSGHATSSDHPICRLAAEVVGNNNLIAFNSGCEAGLRAGLLGTPTLVWGPGSLAQAHRIDEYLEWESVQRVAQHFVTFATQWCTGR